MRKAFLELASVVGLASLLITVIVTGTWVTTATVLALDANTDPGFDRVMAGVGVLLVLFWTIFGIGIHVRKTHFK